MWGAWIETSLGERKGFELTSHPVWGAWIETGQWLIVGVNWDVAPRVGCVD